MGWITGAQLLAGVLIIHLNAIDFTVDTRNEQTALYEFEPLITELSFLILIVLIILSQEVRFFLCHHRSSRRFQTGLEGSPYFRFIYNPQVTTFRCVSLIRSISMDCSMLLIASLTPWRHVWCMEVNFHVPKWAAWSVSLFRLHYYWGKRRALSVERCSGWPQMLGGWVGEEKPMVRIVAFHCTEISGLLF